MNINKTLFNGCVPFLNEYNCDEDLLYDFFFNTSSRLSKQDRAIKLIKKVMKPHGKEPLLDHLFELTKIEYGIQKSQSWVRDHFVHALYTFVLGVFINEKLIKNNSDCKVKHFSWKIASLFHDIGYPAEIANNMLQAFADKTNSIKKKSLKDRPVHNTYVNLKVFPTGFDDLSNNNNAFDLYLITGLKIRLVRSRRYLVGAP